jgi:hypothetical protein
MSRRKRELSRKVLYLHRQRSDPRRFERVFGHGDEKIVRRCERAEERRRFSGRKARLAGTLERGRRRVIVRETLGFIELSTVRLRVRKSERGGRGEQETFYKVR